MSFPLDAAKTSSLGFSWGLLAYLGDLGLSDQGEYCRTAMHNIENKFISVIYASLDSWWVEPH